MKIYQRSAPPLLIVITIKRQGEKNEYLTVCETDLNESLEVFKNYLKDKVLLFPEGRRTIVEVRERIGGDNGKTKSFPLFGLSPKEVKELIIKKLTK